MMPNLFFKELYFKVLLLLTSFSFITGYRFEYLDKLFYFDILMVIYVLSSLFVKKVLVSTFTFNFIKILFIILLPSIILVNFTNNILDSLQFLSQYLFLILILPLFLESIYLTNQYNFFLKTLLFALIINSILFLLKYFEIIGQLYFSENFGIRFAIGEFTPNEMGHYLVLMLFLITLLGSYRFKIFIEFFSITLLFNPIINSRVVWLPLFIYIYTYHYKKVENV